MAAYKINISRIEELITQYAETNGIDSNVGKMVSAADNIKKHKVPSFAEIVLLAGLLQVSPDYILGLTDSKEPEDKDMSKILFAMSRLDADMRHSLSKKAEEYVFIQNNTFSPEDSGIEMITVDTLSESAHNTAAKAADVKK